MDRRMRHITLSFTEAIEIRMKSMIAYYHSEKYRPPGYLDMNNFDCSNDGRINLPLVSNYLHITRKAESQKDNMKESELFIKHHRENKNDVLPFWVYVEILTISDASKLYTLIDEDLCFWQV